MYPTPSVIWPLCYLRIQGKTYRLWSEGSQTSQHATKWDWYPPHPQDHNRISFMNLSSMPLIQQPFHLPLHLPTLSTLHWPIFNSHSCLVQGPPSISSTWTNHFSTNFSTLPDISLSTTLLLISSFLILSLFVTPHIPLKPIYDIFVSMNADEKSYIYIYSNGRFCER